MMTAAAQPGRATVHDWIEGARLRTLPAAIAPVLAGTAAASHLGEFHLGRALLALLVALALQIGVNFSNDYSDGIRGTDDHRQGPQRLTGGGLAKPRTVLAVALGCFAVAGVAGLGLLALSNAWILLVPGIGAVAAAWFYTGGSRPYAYRDRGVSELMVFLFFGWLATLGTTWTQAGALPWWAWTTASGLGLLSIALLVVNNLRDIPTDTEAGKHTLAVRLGDAATRRLHAGVLAAAGVLLAVSVVAVRVEDAASGAHLLRNGVAVVGLVLLALATRRLAREVLSGAAGRALIPVLRDTGLLTLTWALFFASVAA